MCSGQPGPQEEPAGGREQRPCWTGRRWTLIQPLGQDWDFLTQSTRRCPPSAQLQRAAGSHVLKTHTLIQTQNMGSGDVGLSSTTHPHSVPLCAGERSGRPAAVVCSPSASCTQTSWQETSVVVWRRCSLFEDNAVIGTTRQRRIGSKE